MQAPEKPATAQDFLGFDPTNPPDPNQIDACVHCGFCLATCPSYRVIGKENDSPRGRIYLMDGINTGEVEFTDTSIQHFDSCLGCLACVTTCPSGVQYDQLIEATRAQVTRNADRPLMERLLRQGIFNIFPYPDRLRLLLRPVSLYQKFGLQKWVRSTGLLGKISPQLAAMEGMLTEIPDKAWRDTLPEIIPAQGEPRYRVGMLLGCVQRLFNPDVNEATVRVLTANGCEVAIPPSQGCCGALSHHQGQEAQAEDLARQTIDSFAAANVDYVLINASGCGHTLKEYGHILKDDEQYRDRAKAFSAKVKDVQEFLAEVGLTTPLSPLQDAPLTMVYQDACHMLHGQKISVQPRQLLKQIPGVKLREPIDAALCCGSAGVYNILQPEVAHELGQQKANNLTNTGAQVIASANIGCYVQISKHLEMQGKAVPVLHPMQLLDMAIQGQQLLPPAN
ncbi:4Fe-4S dicluster domain-containing protein [filamentous cyanobacterium LEGE 11480]|uniref:Glycolate oxidase iron-sulfur subunit n=1 Tax=Romeriopsis navalis LEGE 11480 TaxID=2777977 RepID=A0A928Z3G6_9CYAN|nr:heterodisulfide reductase-related iron-sulfur binding cluster [Romeriopsis navalis]MBE9031501.1 4Fe-4S dicluster domain-containing protein [Romeriopsis navalis LEGE 11480]